MKAGAVPATYGEKKMNAAEKTKNQEETTTLEVIREAVQYKMDQVDDILHVASWALFFDTMRNFRKGHEEELFSESGMTRGKIMNFCDTFGPGGEHSIIEDSQIDDLGDVEAVWEVEKFLGRRI
tara:strand:- start:9693 stop:10064 length:372 start_codon:yes stop_codon:yes gene_type:complete